jgi:hypothetical protein
MDEKKKRTSLGEEGAKASVRLCGFSLFREISIGLRESANNIVHNHQLSELRNVIMAGKHGVVPVCHARGSIARTMQISDSTLIKTISSLDVVIPPSTHWRFGSQLGRLLDVSTGYTTELGRRIRLMGGDTNHSS